MTHALELLGRMVALDGGRSRGLEQLVSILEIV
nr:MAG TPA_asm: hypothetical protein [Caudoviricetes sp.]